MKKLPKSHNKGRRTHSIYYEFLRYRRYMFIPPYRFFIRYLTYMFIPPYRFFIKYLTLQDYFTLHIY